jgi:hypothetical protein
MLAAGDILMNLMENVQERAAVREHILELNVCLAASLAAVKIMAIAQIAAVCATITLKDSLIRLRTVVGTSAA